MYVEFKLWGGKWMVGYGWLFVELDFMLVKVLGRYILYIGFMCKVVLWKLNVMFVLVGVLKEFGVWWFENWFSLVLMSDCVDL